MKHPKLVITDDKGKAIPSKRVKLSVDDLRNMAYNQYLKTSHYKKLSKAVKQRVDYTCEICGISKKQSGIIFHSHHMSYDNRGDYDNEINDMVCLCSACHAIEHNKTNTKAFITCSCGNKIRLLNLGSTGELITNMDMDTGDIKLTEKDCQIIYKCPYCDTSIITNIDLYNIQKALRINNWY